jgi:general secretion pathway protein A
VAVLASTTWLVWVQQDRGTLAPAAAPAAVQAEGAPAAVAAEPASAPPAAAAAPTDLASLLQGAAAVTDLDGAYTRLFGLWKARYVAGSEAACSQALRQGLECLDEEGGLEALRRYNRPAILALQDNSGAVHQVIVAGLAADKARLMIGDAMHEVPLAELQPRWGGDFLLLWKPPQLDTRSLAPGMYGEPVLALRQRLRQWAGLPPESGRNEFFDDGLRELVMQFQRRNGLAADGIAGVRTQALLDAAVATAGTPLLSAAAQ